MSKAVRPVIERWGPHVGFFGDSVALASCFEAMGAQLHNEGDGIKVYFDHAEDLFVGLQKPIGDIVREAEQAGMNEEFGPFNPTIKQELESALESMKAEWTRAALAPYIEQGPVPGISLFVDAY